MKILDYTYEDTAGWKLGKFPLKQINLLVGKSGSGKTKILNSISNGANCLVKAREMLPFKWEMTLEIEKKKYSYAIQSARVNNECVITGETLKEIDGSIERVILKRSLDEFIYNGSPLPRLASNESSIYLLKDEDTIKPIYNGFRRILRRDFFAAALNDAVMLQAIESPLESIIARNKNLEDIWTSNFSLSTRLYFLKKYFPEKYADISRAFKATFDFIRNDDVRLFDANSLPVKMQGDIPIYCILEQGSDDWIPLGEFSSGMIKVLLIITDVISMPNGMIYLIDEYENSLGINAIDFLPQLLADFAQDNQFLITTHHPYLINEISIKNWLIVSRIAKNIFVTPGEKLVDKFGKSKQKAFVQLTNDPTYDPNLKQ